MISLKATSASVATEVHESTTIAFLNIRTQGSLRITKVLKRDGFHSRDDSEDVGYRPWSYATYLLLGKNVKFFSSSFFC